MDNYIFLSIKTGYIERILQGTKAFEFRNYKPKQNLDYVIFYETLPQAKIRYVAKVDYILKYPEQIPFTTDSQEEYNSGNKTKYAYHIEKVYKLREEISLENLKKEYNFAVPQSLIYGSKYPELVKKISSEI